MADKNGLYTSFVPALTEKQKAIAGASTDPIAKLHLTSVPATLITQCDPGRASGLEKPEMRARNKGATPKSVPPGAMTRKEKIAGFLKLERSLSPEMRLKARKALGL